ncbi:MAG: crossover junction endodeoxyribonuclease RuvC [Candidatus Zambryskibacteria bacterium RIFOXYC1_FULL_39_10]|uniref:Crossover junction endodeoxyribonuclease RuvC n=1 Tax=Candidatus Zambryskibacteria bacterium RIFOXYC1_FULL_39_10 TaxID=1802779 RepID=A0A1G2V044_9BACT|nr:MAG: crossover junction endodeoxyribonuclease RuvC [Candidatus Zambryskibacteria bacterium RIFOXYD1_FULL_39_35]OHB14992.1 MAG: crossover junction endodeoxyribonuclease RuvC [Candidatus Zambryskibacteria bacterium RIFOXYC1_FULL_39_10]
MQNKKVASSQHLVSRILGIDPGYGRIGIAVVEKTNRGENLIHSECFETDAKLEHSKRLLALGEKIKATINKYEPNKIAIETLLWSKNKKTALQVAEARGVILLEAERSGVLIKEYNPNQIKLAVTGYGKSDKKQVINMVEKLIKLEPGKRHDDEYDAIAIALTCSAISLSTEKLV